MRRPIKRKNKLVPDEKYNSLKVAKFINHIMLDGRKDAARKVVYGALEIIKEKASVEDPLEIFDKALKNAAPNVEVRSRRVGGANYQVPYEVRKERQQFLGMTWIVNVARGRKGKKMKDILAEELMLAANGEGDAVKKRENTHKMADANKAFAHFAW